MNTMIVSAFPGCGKTYLYERQDILNFTYLGERKRFTFCDSDSSKYKKECGWEKKYADDIEKKLGTVDFLFISQHEEILQELNSRNIPFVIVSPDNAYWTSDLKRQLVKQQWFGRFLLRDNSHIKDFSSWLSTLKDNYDNWTSIKHITKYNPTSFFLLEETQYISDIIADLYWKKEKITEYNYHHDNNADQEYDAPELE